MVTIAKFSKSEDAYSFRTFLDAEGVESYIFDEHISQLLWHYTRAFGGVRVVVADEDFDQAEELHAQYDESMKSTPFVEPTGRARPIMALVSLICGFPVMLFGIKTKTQDDDADAEIRDHITLE